MDHSAIIIVSYSYRVSSKDKNLFHQFVYHV